MAEMEPVVRENYHRLLAAAMLRIASTVGVRPPAKMTKVIFLYLSSVTQISSGGNLSTVSDSIIGQASNSIIKS